MYSVDGQLHQRQPERPEKRSKPYPLRRRVEIRHPFRSRNKSLQGRTSAAQKSFYFFPDYYFLISINLNRSALEPLSRVNQERRALLDHAALCRRVAGETSHTIAAKRLRMMAQEYESRAHRLEGVVRAAEDDVGAT